MVAFAATCKQVSSGSDPSDTACDGDRTRKIIRARYVFKEILVSSPTSARSEDHSFTPQAWGWEAVTPKPEKVVKYLTLSPSIERFINQFLPLTTFNILRSLFL